MWFMLKFPHYIGYILFTLSAFYYNVSIDSISSPLYSTVLETYNVNYIFYNDQPSSVLESSVSFAHSKGIIGFNNTHCWWVQHSIPRFPNHRDPQLKDYVFAQHVVYNVFEIESLDTLLKALLVIRPNIYSYQLSQEVRLEHPLLNELLNPSISFQSAVISFKNLTLIVKNKNDKRFLYDDLIADHYKSDFLVETWQNGANRNEMPSYCGKENIRNIRRLCFGARCWNSTLDHSKWTIGVNKSIVCFGDLNRQYSQRNRAGLAVCFENRGLHSFLNRAIVETEEYQPPSYNQVITEDTFQLTLEQQEVLSKIIDWVETPLNLRKRIFHVSGPAGVGKTTCIEYLVKFMIEKRIPYRVATPTHKACRILRNRVGGVCTIHNLFQLKLDYDDDGNLITPTQTPVPQTNTFAIIDESSMISDVLYDNMINSEYYFVCFGDSAQLPPVENGKLQSIVYDKYPIDCHLTHVIRNTEPTLITLRNTILAHKSPKLNAENVLVNLGSESIQFEDVNQLVELYVNAPTDDKIVLCYRNKTCEATNNAIRKNLFTSPEEFCEGERIIWEQYYEQNFIKRYTSHTDIVTEVKITTIECQYTCNTYKVWQLTLQEDAIKIHRVHASSIKKFTKDFAVRKSEILQSPKKWRANLWKEFYDNRNFLHAPINYNYSVSIHKSQGSEYEHVFLNEADFEWLEGINFKKSDDDTWSTPMTITEKIATRLSYLKLLYVGASRMKKRCTIGVKI